MATTSSPCWRCSQGTAWYVRPLAPSVAPPASPGPPRLPSFLQAFPTSPFCLARARAFPGLWSSARPRSLLWAHGPAAFLPETLIQ